MKNVDIDEPTSFFDHVDLGCTQRACKPNETVIEQDTKMFESRISAGATNKKPGWEKPHAKTIAWSYVMEGHAKQCVERFCELANKAEQLHKVWSPCLDDHQFKKEELESVGDFIWLCSQIVLKCLYLARIGRPDISWSVNKLVRGITKWTQACDRCLARLISYRHHTQDWQLCNVGNTAEHCRLGFLQDSDFAGNLEDSKSTSGGILCLIGSRTFVPVNWLCEKQTSLSHSSTGRWTEDGWSSWMLDLKNIVIQTLRSPQTNKKPSIAASANRMQDRSF